MIDDYSRDLLRSGIIELKAGNRDTARRYLDRALYMSGDHDVIAEAWYWMSLVADNPADQRHALENCLTHDLRHARARRALAVLDGRLRLDEIVDPDALHAAGFRGATGAVAQRFMCPKCGGRMTYSPDGQSLSCEYCARRTPIGGLRTAKPQTGPLRLNPTGPLRPNPTGPLRPSPTGPLRPPPGAPKDFLLTMATARGHGKPLNEQVVICQGCSAQFILPPQQMSITCPYCGSPHVVNYDKSPDLIAPDGILPHAFDAAHATSILADWLKKKLASLQRDSRFIRRTTLPMPRDPTLPIARGLYLPLWTFDLGGAIDYTGEVIENQDIGFGRQGPRPVLVTDSYPVLLSGLPIPASRKLSGPFVNLIPTFDLKAIQPYDPRYLSDWPAELYDIPMDEASLDARSQGFLLLKRDMVMRLAPLRLYSASSAHLLIDSFRLNLLPVWMSEIVIGGGSHILLVNGQTGDVRGDLDAKPSTPGSLRSWLADLIRD